MNSSHPAMSTNLSRRSFLRDSGLSALAASSIPVLASTSAHANTSPRAAAGSESTGGPIMVDDRFPIGLFWPPPPTETTTERYQEIAEAGFTVVHGGNYTYADVHINRHLLAVAEETGLHVLVDDPEIRWLTHQFEIGDSSQPFTLSEDEVRQKIAEVINRYAPQWRVQVGRLLIAGGSGNGSIGWVAEGTDWKDYTLAFDTEPRFTGSGGYAQAGWAFRVQDEANAYVWLLHSQGADGNAKLTKAVFTNGAPAVTNVALGFPVEDGQTYHIETSLVGSTITTSIDGVVVDTTNDSTFSSGSAGFREAGPESAFFDNVTVTDGGGSVLFTEDFSGNLSAWRRPAGSGNTSFAGLHVYDEPVVGKFAQLATTIDRANEAYPDALHYINHFPNFAGGFGDGTAYNQAAEQIDTPVLSFDRYPILTSGEDIGYFENWAQIRSAALEHGREAWVYIQSVGYSGHAVPTEEDLRWQISISLAYGCRGIQYFTYWTPDPARGEAFHDGLITVDGRRGDLYQIAKRVNLGYLAPLGREMRQLTSTAVQAAGVADLPKGLDPFEPDEKITAVSGDPVVLGRFTGDGDHRYVLVANYSRHEAASVQVSFSASVVEAFDVRSETYRRVQSDQVELDPGNGLLIRLE